MGLTGSLASRSSIASKNRSSEVSHVVPSACKNIYTDIFSISLTLRIKIVK